MPKFIIERDIPDAGTLTSDQLHGIGVDVLDRYPQTP